MKLLLFLLGCWSGDRSVAPKATVVLDTIVVATSSDVGTTLPILTQNSAEEELSHRLFLPTVLPHFDCRWVFKPALAESWSWSDDGLELTLKLRKGVRWADGTEVTATDLAFTADRMGDPESGSRYISSLQNVVGHEVLGPYGIRWRFARSYDRDSQLRDVAGIPAIPAHLLERVPSADLAAHELSRQPVSSGPWVLGPRVLGERYTLLPNEMFSGPETLRPKLGRVVFRVLPEYSTRLTELLSGGVDMVAGLEVADLGRIRREHPEIKLYRRGWRNIDAIAWNHGDPRFADPNVRRALGLALDVDRMIADLMTDDTGEAYARRATGPFSPAICDLDEMDITPLAHDPAQAKRLLEEAGWRDTDRDGWLDKDGERFVIEMLLVRGRAHRHKAAVFVQADLAAIGVAVELVVQDGASTVQRVLSRDYEAAVLGWSPALSVDPSGLLGLDGEELNRGNFVGYRSLEVQRLMEAGLAESDLTAAMSHWRQLARVVHADQPYTFLWWRDEVVAVHGRFRDVGVGPVARLGQLERWWVPEDEVRYRAP